MVTHGRIIKADDPGRLLIVAFVLFTITIISVCFIFVTASDWGATLPYFFLLPWILCLAAVFAVPSIILYIKGQFSFADPIVFATWSYFVPAFVIGGLTLSLGWSQPYFLYYIQDPINDLPYTVILVALGFLGLWAGYFLPLGTGLGKLIRVRLPKVEIPLSNYVVPSLLLLGIGMVTLTVGLLLGIAGYQVTEQINSYDGLIIATGQVWMEAIFLLWFIVFKKKQLDFSSFLVIGIVLTTFVVRALYAGNRGSLLHLFIAVFLAYILAEREFKKKQAAVSAVALLVCIAVGVLYGTMFRLNKGGEEAASISQYTDNIFQTFDELGRNDSSTLALFASGTLAERLDNLSSAAVVISNYEKLEPFEEQYGLKNNIVNDTTTFFIPRIVWNDKPVASDPRKYSDLYFNYGQNSFAITPIGDLLRNFGPIGVPVGMLILGVILRMIYIGLIEVGNSSPWKATIYYILLVSFSYESFYGSIIPNLVKNGVIAVVGVAFVVFLSRWIKARQDNVFSSNDRRF